MEHFKLVVLEKNELTNLNVIFINTFAIFNLSGIECKKTLGDKGSVQASGQGFLKKQKNAPSLFKWDLSVSRGIDISLSFQGVLKTDVF